MLLDIDRTHYLDPKHYERWEKEHATPALEALGYTVKKWYTVDMDRWRRVTSRGVILVKDGVESYFYCYAHGL
jgi:hypothetical protein